MYLANKQIRDKVEDLCKEALQSDVSDNLKAALQDWIDNKDDGEGSKKHPMHCLRQSKPKAKQMTALNEIVEKRTSC